jgi:hypothetical protein
VRSLAFEKTAVDLNARRLPARIPAAGRAQGNMLLRRAAPATSLRLPTAALRRAPDACGAWAPARGKKEEAAKGKAKPAKATKAKKKDADERAAKYRKQGRIVEDDLDDEEEDYPVRVSRVRRPPLTRAR